MIISIWYNLTQLIDIDMMILIMFAVHDALQITRETLNEMI